MLYLFASWIFSNLGIIEKAEIAISQEGKPKSSFSLEVSEKFMKPKEEYIYLR